MLLVAGPHRGHDVEVLKYVGKRIEVRDTGYCRDDDAYNNDDPCWYQDYRWVVTPKAFGCDTIQEVHKKRIASMKKKIIDADFQLLASQRPNKQKILEILETVNV